jgi:hypothetical protein
MKTYVHASDEDVKQGTETLAHLQGCERSGPVGVAADPNQLSVRLRLPG